MVEGVTFQEAEEGKAAQGLSKQDEFYLECSACSRKLVYIMVVNSQDGYDFHYRANCPYCGDKSFKKQIQGRIYYGPVPRINEESDNDDDWGLLTNVEAPEPSEDGTCWEFKVTKVNKQT